MLADASKRAVMPMSGNSTYTSQMSETGSVDPNSPKSGWADRMPGGPPLRDELAQIVDSDGGRDQAENGYFESVNDPQFTGTETAQRRFKSQLRRRLRHLESKTRNRASE